MMSQQQLKKWNQHMNSNRNDPQPGRGNGPPDGKGRPDDKGPPPDRGRPVRDHGSAASLPPTNGS